MYIIVTSQNGKSHYLAKQRIGGGYSTIATFQNEITAKETADLLNNRFDPPTLARAHSTRAKLREVTK